MTVAFYGKGLSEPQKKHLTAQIKKWAKENPSAASSKFEIEYKGEMITGFFSSNRSLDITVKTIDPIDQEDQGPESSTATENHPSAFDRAVAQGIIEVRGPHIYLKEGEEVLDRVVGKKIFLEKYPQFK